MPDVCCSGSCRGRRGNHRRASERRLGTSSEVGLSRFRNHYEHIIIHQMAQQILRRCHDQSRREAALAMERKTPIDTQLAIDWLGRFDSYYAMRYPIYSAASSIAAHRSTLLEEDRPYDRPPTPEEPDGHTQEMRAQHYGWEGLYYLAWFYAELSRFETRFGGRFLLSSKEAEANVDDATYLMYYFTPFGRQQQSFLRLKYDEAAGEMHTFSLLKAEDPHFTHLHDLWQRFLALCACSWDEKQPPERGHFHTHHTVATISEECSPHQLISAANDYCTIIKNEWDLIADWYRDSETRRRPVDPSRLYWKLREQQRRKGSDEWPPWGPPTP